MLVGERMTLVGGFTAKVVFIFVSMLFANACLAQFSSNPLSQAVDNTAFDFVTEAPPVFSQTDTYNFDGDAAEMANIPNDGVTLMTTFVPVATNLSYDWKVSSETNYDFLVFRVFDDEFRDTGISRQISGEQDWQTVSLAIPAGGHWLVWGYIKDGTETSGQDTGWVDNIRIGNTGGEDSNAPTPKFDPAKTLPPIINLLLEEPARPVMFNVSGSSVKEGEDINFNIVLNEVDEELVQIDCTPINGTAQADIDYEWSYNYDVFPYQLEPVRLSFLPGQTNKSITVQTYNWNEQYYESKNFQLRCQQVGTSEASSAIATIIYRPNIRFSEDNPYYSTINEGELINLEVAVEGQLVNETVVNYTIYSDQAVAGSNYIDETGGTISFLPGETSKIISIRTLDNNSANRASEIEITLSSVTLNAENVDLLFYADDITIFVLDNEPNYFPEVDIADLTPAIGSIAERGPHVSIESAGGEQIGLGFNYIYDQQNSNIDIIRSGNDVIRIEIEGDSQPSVSNESWSITMTAGSGEINLGAYSPAYSDPRYYSNENELQVRGPAYNSCVSTGSYRIYEYELSAGLVTKLTADFEVICDGSNKPLRGAIKYDVSLPNAIFPPLPVPLTEPYPTLPDLSSSGTVVEIEGAEGDWITLGESYSFNNSNANFSLNEISNNTGIRITIDSANSGSWNIELQRHQNEIYNLNNGRLAVGVYDNVSGYPFNTINPGLSFSGPGRGCSGVTGRFTVYEVSYDLLGSLESLTADFEQACNYGVFPTAKGSIKYIR